jgi:hypothetical protein
VYWSCERKNVLSSNLNNEVPQRTHGSLEGRERLFFLQRWNCHSQTVFQFLHIITYIFTMWNLERTVGCWAARRLSWACLINTMIGIRAHHTMVDIKKREIDICNSLCCLQRLAHLTYMLRSIACSVLYIDCDCPKLNKILLCLSRWC